MERLRRTHFKKAGDADSPRNPELKRKRPRFARAFPFPEKEARCGRRYLLPSVFSPVPSVFSPASVQPFRPPE